MFAFAFKSSNSLSWSKHWYNLINNLVLNNSASRSFIKINSNFHVNKRQCGRQTFFSFSFFCICLNSFKIVNNSFILHFFSSSFHNIIGFIFSQVQVLTFRFDLLRTNLIAALKVRFIFFLTSACNFIAAEDKKKRRRKCFKWLFWLKSFFDYSRTIIDSSLSRWQYFFFREKRFQFFM